MIRLAGMMAPMLARTTMIREQLGFALNRARRRDEAKTVLKTLIEEQGASSETNGLLGRVYKDRWEDAVKAGRTIEARGWLRKAIDAYVTGYTADLSRVAP
jgi:hypothetical protein